MPCAGKSGRRLCRRSSRHPPCCPLGARGQLIHTSLVQVRQSRRTPLRVRCHESQAVGEGGRPLQGPFSVETGMPHTCESMGGSSDHLVPRPARLVARGRRLRLRRRPDGQRTPLAGGSQPGLPGARAAAAVRGATGPWPVPRRCSPADCRWRWPATARGPWSKAAWNGQGCSHPPPRGPRRRGPPAAQAASRRVRRAGPALRSPRAPGAGGGGLPHRCGGARPARKVTTAAGSVEAKAPWVNDKRTDLDAGDRKRVSSTILPRSP